jgi:hypothetical protein
MYICYYVHYNMQNYNYSMSINAELNITFMKYLMNKLGSFLVTAKMQ